MKEMFYLSPAQSSYLLILLFSLIPAASSDAQSFDEQLLERVYRTDAPVFRAAMRAADWSAYPVFAGAPMGAWAAAAMGSGVSYAEAYRWSLAEGVALVGTSALKHLYRRERPASAMAGITPRLNRVDRWVLARDSYSFPSGHAALSAALVTAWSLSRPEWYVVAPSAAWASAVAVSRMWVGVHYPTDVLAGVAIGVAAGAVVHVFQTALTPEVLREESAPLPSIYLEIDLQ